MNTIANILVTGAAGFIGSHLCDYLVSSNYHVTAIDNLSLGKMDNINHLVDLDNFTFHKIDILDYRLMQNLFYNTQFASVFHLAANSDIARSHFDSDIDVDNTFMTTYNILKLMKEFSVNEIIFASSSAIYGENFNNLSEDTGPLKPTSHYGASKLASEAFISSYVENYKLKAWIIRFPNVVGPRSTHGVIFDFINKLRINQDRLEILGNGEQIKPYLYVQDLIDAISFIWKNTKEKINVFNVGVDSRTKVIDIAMYVIREMHLNPEFNFTGGEIGWIGDVPEFKYDLSKIAQLGWRANLSSNDSVQKAIAMILKKQ